MKRNGIANLLREFFKHNDRALRILISGLVPLIIWKFLLPGSYYASPYVVLLDFAFYLMTPTVVIVMIYDFLRHIK